MPYFPAKSEKCPSIHSYSEPNQFLAYRLLGLHPSMNRNEESTWRATRIPYRIIESRYGTNTDNASDDIYEALQLVSEYHGQYKYRFSLETNHPNPWFHSLVFEIENIPDSTYTEFLQKLISKGLIDVQNSA